MQGSKPCALPLGDTPVSLLSGAKQYLPGTGRYSAMVRASCQYLPSHYIDYHASLAEINGGSKLHEAVMKGLKFIVLIIGVCLSPPTMSAANGKECVILLHGLGRTNHSMFRLESVLKKQQYIVVNHSYPSTRKSINTLSKQIQPMVNECLGRHATRIHFVTHSLGGIILQQYLHTNRIPTLTYIVMLAPPNHGSQLADLLHKRWFFRRILGPAIEELTTDKPDISMLPGQYKIGIIAGNYSLNPVSKTIFAEPNDGKVAVSSTKLQQMSDFIVLPATHTFIMQNPLAQKQISYFLSHGCFLH